MPGTNPFLPSPEPTEAQLREARLQSLIAELLRDGQRLLAANLTTITSGWDTVWGHAEFSASEIFERLGTRGAEVMRTCALFTEALYRVGMESPSPTLILDAKYLSAAQPYTAGEDGTVTLTAE